MYEQTKMMADNMIQSGIFPGVSLAFLEPTHTEKWIKGYTQWGEIEALEDGLFYDLASITKAFVTSMLLLQMLEKGELSIDEPVCSYFPKMKEKKVTIRHLVTHTSGLEGYIPNRNQLSAEQLLAALTEQLSCGSSFSKQVKYTDTGFVLAGCIIEKIMNKPIAQVFRERMIEPLGIQGMMYGPLSPNRCVPTERLETGEIIRGSVHDPKARILGSRCGSAGLFANLEACIQYVRWLLADGTVGDQTIIGAKWMQRLQEDWTPTGQAGRSLGWDFQPSFRGTWLKHTGFTGTIVMWNRIEQRGFVCLSNRIHTFSDTPAYNQLRDQLIRQYLKEVEEDSRFYKKGMLE